MILRDNSVRIFAEQKLQQSKLSLKQAQAISNVGKWNLDFATGATTMSEQALKKYGIAVADTQHSYETFYLLFIQVI